METQKEMKLNIRLLYFTSPMSKQQLSDGCPFMPGYQAYVMEALPV